jgi:cyclopropane fatty-acyl-phospholipid synthase-like methyltransferase
MFKWYENAEFWEVMAPKLFGAEKIAETKQEIDQIISLLKITAGSTVLDLCCGQGRHSLELARRDFNTTGVDRTLKYLEKAKDEAKEQNLSIEFIEDDMRHFKRLDYFNAIIIMYTSFGYFEEHNENMQVLHNCYYSLKDNGSLLIDLMGKEVVARIFCERESYQLNGSTYIEERKVSKDWSWMENRWIKQTDNSRQEFKLSHWLYSANELSIMLKEVGFRITKFFGNLGGDPYDHTAQRLIALASK